MSKGFWTGSNGGASASFGSTHYIAWGSTRFAHTSELATQIKFRGVGTLRNVYVRVVTNTANGTSTVKSRKNGANGNLSVSIGASSTGTFSDTSNSDAMADGDLWNWQLVVGGSSGSINLAGVSALVETGDDQPSTPLVSSNLSTVLTQGTTRYAAFGGTIGYGSTDSGSRQISIEDATLSGLQVRVITNSITQATTVRTRKNGANGNQLVSIGAATTGLFEDVSNTDTLAALDEYGFQIIGGTGTTNSILVTAIAVNYLGTGLSKSVVQTTAGAGLSTPQRYGTFFNVGPGSTTESAVVLLSPSDAILSNLRVFVGANNRDGTSTIKTRINSSDGTVLVSVGASASGQFSDTTHSDQIAAGQPVGLTCTPGGSSGTISLGSITLQVETLPHALTSSQVATAPPQTTAATISQTYVLSSTNVATAAPAITQATVGLGLALEAADVETSEPEIGESTLGIIQALESIGVETSEPTITPSDVGIIHILVSLPVETWAPSITQETLAEIYVLEAQDIETTAATISVSDLIRIVAFTPLTVSTGPPEISESAMVQGPPRIRLDDRVVSLDGNSIFDRKVSPIGSIRENRIA